MDEYYLLIIILTILMLFYGGTNKILQFEYDYTYFKCIQNIRLLKNYLLKNSSKENIDLMSKTKNISILINNLEHLEYVNIKPFQYYINDIMYDKSPLMIIYTVNNDFNKLQVVIDKLDNKQFLNYNVSSDLFITYGLVIKRSLETL